MDREAGLDGVEDLLGGAIDDRHLPRVAEGHREEILPVPVMLRLLRALVQLRRPGLLHVPRQQLGAGGALAENAVTTGAPVEIDPLGLLELFFAHGGRRGGLGEGIPAGSEDQQEPCKCQHYAFHGDLLINQTLHDIPGYRTLSPASSEKSIRSTCRGRMSTSSSSRHDRRCWSSPVPFAASVRIAFRR